jgi:hypothetical protein
MIGKKFKILKGRGKGKEIMVRDKGLNLWTKNVWSIEYVKSGEKDAFYHHEILENCEPLDN